MNDISEENQYRRSLRDPFQIRLLIVLPVGAGILDVIENGL